MYSRSSLEHIPLFKTLSPASLAYLAAHSEELKYRAGKVIFNEEAHPAYLYLVQQGVVHLYKEAREGRKSLVNTVIQDQLFGEEAFLANLPCEYSAEAGTTVRLLRISNEALRKVIQKNPDVTLQLSLGLCHKLRQVHMKLVKEKHKNVTVVIYNDGDLRTKAWLALELALSLREQCKRKVLLLDLASQSPSIQDITNLKKPYDYLVINLPQEKNKLTETVLKYSTHILNLSRADLPYEQAQKIEVPREKDEREWFVGNLARRIAKRTIGLALGSGTTGGLAHIGVFKALEKLKIPIDMIAGTSGGALYGAMFAAGKSAAEIERFVVEQTHRSVFSYLRPAFSFSGLFSAQNIIRGIQKFLRIKNFQELNVPLKIIAADLNNNHKLILAKGDLFRAIAASISMPIMFKTEKLGNKMLSDGAAVDPLPVDVLRENDIDIIIACYPSQQKAGKRTPRNALDVYMTTRNISNDMLAMRSGRRADVFINPDTSRYGAFEYNKAQELIDLGEKAALKKLNDIGRIFC